jgi:hypothetical protein
LYIPADLLEDGRCDTFDAPPFGRFVQLDPAAFHFCPPVQHLEQQVGRAHLCRPAEQRQLSLDICPLIRAATANTHSSIADGGSQCRFFRRFAFRL